MSTGFGPGGSTALEDRMGLAWIEACNVEFLECRGWQCRDLGPVRDYVRCYVAMRAERSIGLIHLELITEERESYFVEAVVVLWSGRTVCNQLEYAVLERAVLLECHV